jgi:hypothetical protein
VDNNQPRRTRASPKGDRLSGPDRNGLFALRILWFYVTFRTRSCIASALIAILANSITEMTAVSFGSEPKSTSN